MPQNQEIICVACPKGCRLEIQREGEAILVGKAGCKRGEEYAVQEINDPRRMVASTVRIRGAGHALLPVYTAKPFPKAKIQELLKHLRMVTAQVPVQMGSVILPNALNTGIDVLASRDMES